SFHGGARFGSNGSMRRSRTHQCQRHTNLAITNRNRCSINDPLWKQGASFLMVNSDVTKTSFKKLCKKQFGSTLSCGSTWRKLALRLRILHFVVSTPGYRSSILHVQCFCM